MRKYICLVAMSILTLAAGNFAQETRGQPAKVKLTKSIYSVPNQECADCATALEGSLKKVEGIKSISVSFPAKLATVDFDESVISAQEVTRAMFQAPHAMGANMKYRAFLLLSVPDANTDATRAKATTALAKVEGSPRLHSIRRLSRSPSSLPTKEK